jgi:hypothetical protein
MQSPLFGMNPIIAIKYLPVMLNHMAEHIALWYADAMLDSANAVLRQKTGIPDLTIESFKGTQYEAPLDRLLAELTPEVIIHANDALKELPAVIAQAQMVLKRLAPQTPMDPSVVAMHDVTRQSQADEAGARLKLIDAQARVKANEDRVALDAQKQADDAAFKQRQLDAQGADAHLRAVGDAQKTSAALAATQSRETIADAGNKTKVDVAEGNNDAKIEVAHIDTEAAKEIAEKEIKAGKNSRLSDGGSMR